MDRLRTHHIKKLISRAMIIFVGILIKNNKIKKALRLRKLLRAYLAK